MINSPLKTVLIAFIALTSFLAKSQTGDAPQVAHIKVAMRMIGDDVLRSAGDTVSRVLPIEKEGDRYRIRFENEFEFVPFEMITTVEQKVKATDLAEAYLVEVEDCRSGMVVYSYEVKPPLEGDLIACRSRVQPKGCYSILFTVLDGTLTMANEGNTPAESEAGNSTYYLVAIVLVGLLLITGFVWYKRRRPDTEEVDSDPNIITMGAYQFDKLNMTLLFEKEVVELTSKEADLLLVLYTSANSTLERDEILKAVWGSKGDYVGRTLDVFVSKLRKKLEGDANLKIVNVRGVGYKMVVNK